ncbi:hypothetical protein PHYSODRAFT_257212 [Phytophthora sojae]|uniref:Uncharacterized protein n=1 Tax=Phytophthora sojae (strain P6497) TaxID=1094619 RepID=G4ZTF1_PHYSP|nr:hypothetical protein PHYSODRAFT_257212 [Phytophthora sojae]EGZ12915.1 hypothetical protein PHYSODRAFT_257212 [Phytophthora sojae]|eukprot:XP_009530344.1 hypothetical protein PHYSODRAFT_257212 [Phytophthora sojae]
MAPELSEISRISLAQSAHAALAIDQLLRERYYNRRVRKDTTFEVGDLVWVLKPPRGKGITKSAHQWVGPARIVLSAGVDNWEVVRDDTDEHSIVHCSFLVSSRCPSDSLGVIAEKIITELELEDDDAELRRSDGGDEEQVAVQPGDGQDEGQHDGRSAVATAHAGAAVDGRVVTEGREEGQMTSQAEESSVARRSAMDMSSQLDPQALAAFVDDSVFAQMSGKLGADASPKKNLFVAWMLDDYPNKATLQLEASQNRIHGLIRVKIRRAYGHTRVSRPLAQTIAAKTVKDLLAKFVPEARSGTPKLDENEMKRIAEAFTKGRYLGEAHLDLAQYLRDCWKAYTPTKYKAPCVAVVQSDEGSKVEDIASRLKTIYVYANKHWANVQKEWLKLFTEKAADTSVKAKLSDETDTLEGDTSTEKNPNGRIVVLVIDEARSLLAEKGGKKNDFRMLRNALRSVNKDIGHRGCIFGVLIDTNSRISDLAPPLLLDPSSRLFDGELASFAPVVLAETMDAHWDQYCEEKQAGEDEEMKEDIQDVDEEMKEEILDAGAEDEEMEEETQVAVGAEKDEEKKKQQERAKIAMYKRIVTGDASQAWHALCRMGRPMWYSTCPNPADREDVINLAANKLLLGLPPSQDAYNKDTMLGVASMLCRLGVRPHSTSALASRATADFMAILAYVNFKREGYVTSYASDPVLALGAMKVWYELKHGLAKYILPQLKNLLLDEALDTGGVGEIGEMVARILLLLAMDTCVMGDKDFSQCYHTIGQFVPVQDFLDVLQGKKKLPIYLKRMISKENLRPEFNMWCSKWDGWYMGFTHFVQLQLEPNEDTLWDPKPLGSTDVRDTIRIYMNPKKKGNASEVKEESQAKKRAKIESNPGVSSVSSVSEEDPVFTICLRLLNRVTYPFLSEDVASILSNMVESQYDPLGLVEGDLDYRDEDEKRNKDVSSTPVKH